MKRESTTLCLVSAISFIAGVIVGPFAMMILFELISPNREPQARSFFYRTMNELFEDTYNTEEGSVSPEFLEAFKKYESQLGKKCHLHIFDGTSGYYECFAFFPLGDVFSLAIILENDSWKLYGFDPVEWDPLWENAVERSKNIQYRD